jgi:Flp pilus assembly protein CpaB
MRGSPNLTSPNRHSLSPTIPERLLAWLRPDFARTVLARRVAAGLLVVLAAASALRPDPAGTYVDVVVAATDLRPGKTVSAEDVGFQKHSGATLPDGALTNLDDLVGSTLAGAARRGEIITDVRVLWSRLTGLSAGPDARVVPLHLADAAVLDVIRPGDVVDVLGAPAADAGARPQMLAAAAVVVLVSAAAAGHGDERVVLVALPAAAATAVAGASLVQTVTLTLH